LTYIFIYGHISFKKAFLSGTASKPHHSEYILIVDSFHFSLASLTGNTQNAGSNCPSFPLAKGFLVGYTRLREKKQHLLWLSMLFDK
jgi:hypothetical protein